MVNFLSRRGRKAKGKTEISNISDEVKHMIVYEWAHYTMSIDELANKYNLTWDQLYEIIKNSPTRLLWKEPKKSVR